jgi:hypothetical protein
MTSTVALGDELRDHVILLLEARGYRIEREVRLGTKRVDVVVHIEDQPAQQTFAIECRNYNRNLRQDEVEQVYAAHLSLIQQRKIDGIWIVVRKDFSAEAGNYARNQPGLTLFTIAEFEEVQFRFRRYVRQLMEMFTEEDLEHYYIQQRYEAGLLSEHVLEWVDGNDPKPIAILGGYGMGKTSFCKYLVAHLGNRYLENQSHRVPIYIRLSEIAKEQDLDGLVSKMLASRYRLANYNFQDVMSLNKRGKFVFIFDGFDEMKHALTWEQFKFNFTQINRTVTGASRVIIAGRPNAFLSDAEHSWALRGTKISGDRNWRMPDSPEYEELTIQQFSYDDSTVFLRRYLERDAINNGADLDETTNTWISGRIAEFTAMRHREDFARPVHLKIFAGLATNRNFVLKDVSVYELYDIATSATLGREMEKFERLAISGERRSVFIQEVAWWLWEKSGGRELNFNPEDVPRSILRKVVTAEQQELDDGLVRELFSGAFIERKFGNNFYFAHRSFLEFFIARELAAPKLQQALGTIDNVINEEILYFLKTSGHFDRFVSYVMALMLRYVGELKLALVNTIHDFIAESDERKAAYLGKNAQQHIPLLFKVLPLYNAGDDEAALAVFRSLIDSDLRSDMEERKQNAFYFIVDAILYNLQNPMFATAIADVVRAMAKDVKISALRARAIDNSLPRMRFARENLLEYGLLRYTNVAAELAPDRLPRLLVDFGRLYNELAEVRKPKITISNRKEAVLPNVYVYSISVAELPLSTADQRLLVQVIRDGTF